MNAVVQQPVGILVTPEGFERLSRHLAAPDRANLLWFPNRVQKAVLDPLWSISTPDQLDEKEGPLGLELADICFGLTASLVRLLAGDREALIRMTEDAGKLTLSAARERILDRLGEAAWDSVEWAWRTQIEITHAFSPVLASLNAGVVNSARREIGKDILAQDPSLCAVFGMQLYTLGTLAAAEKEQTPLPALSAEFCHRAYLNACKVMDAVREEGVRIDPYRLDSSEERRERIARAAGQIYSGLSREQLERIEAASLEHSTFTPVDRD